MTGKQLIDDYHYHANRAFGEAPEYILKAATALDAKAERVVPEGHYATAFRRVDDDTGPTFVMDEAGRWLWTRYAAPILSIEEPSRQRYGSPEEAIAAEAATGGGETE
jgi:hypothetical protein